MGSATQSRNEFTKMAMSSMCTCESVRAVANDHLKSSVNVVVVLISSFDHSIR